MAWWISFSTELSDSRWVSDQWSLPFFSIAKILDSRTRVEKRFGVPGVLICFAHREMAPS